MCETFHFSRPDSLMNENSFWVVHNHDIGFFLVLSVYNIDEKDQVNISKHLRWGDPMALNPPQKM